MTDKEFQDALFDATRAFVDDWRERCENPDQATMLSASLVYFGGCCYHLIGGHEVAISCLALAAEAEPGYYESDKSALH